MLEPELAGEPRDAGHVLSVRRPDQARPRARDALDRGVRPGDLVAKDVVVTLVCRVDVVVGVVPELVAFGDDALDDSRPLVDRPPDDEEGRPSVVPGEQVKDGRRRLRWPVVEAEREDPASAEVCPSRDDQRLSRSTSPARFLRLRGPSSVRRSR